MKLTTKITSGFLGIIILTIILLAYTVTKLNHFHNLVDMQEERYQQILLAKKMKERLLGISLEAMDIIVDKDSGKVEKGRVDTLQNLFDEIKKDSKDFEAWMDTAEEKTKAQAVENDFQILKKLVLSDLIAAVDSGAPESSFARLDDEIDPLSHQIEENIEAIIASIGQELKEANQDMTAFSDKVVFYVIAVGGSTIMIALIISILTGRSIITRVDFLQKHINSIAEKRDISQEIPIQYNDEIARITRSINSLIVAMHEVVSEAKQSSYSTASVAEELSSTSREVGKRVEDQASRMEANILSFEKMGESANALVESAEDTQTKIQRASNELDKSRESIGGVIETIRDSAEKGSEMAERLNQLTSDAEQVKGVLGVISDIADQTNLLALNAAIEAARAGEHGRGFAVVADEVRQLAEKTQKSLTEINSTIGIIVQSIMDASDGMNSNAKVIGDLVGVSEEIGYKVDEVSHTMQDGVISVNTAASTNKEMANSLIELVKRSEEINELSSSNTRSVEEISAAVTHLHQLTEEVRDMLDHFVTK